MSLIQPPPYDFLQKIGLSAARWLQDWLNKLQTTQTQANATLQLVGFTLTNNSPVGGQISWSAGTLYYNGVPYSIASGSSGVSQFVWWTVGATTFTSGNTFTPSPSTFPVFTNIAGTADLTWNKLGGGSVRGSHINFQSLYNGPNGVLFLDQITFTNNSPGAGSVAWSAGTAWYLGVPYSITAGSSTNANFWIYWQKSNPTVFQASSTYPTGLGADDFLIGLNGSTGNPAAVGNFTRTWEIRQTNGQTVYISADGSIFGYNAEGKQTFSLGRSAADGGGVNAAGKLVLFDGSGTNTIELDGINGVFQIHQTLAGSSGAASGNFLNININGTAYKINLLNP